jgi:hypothetical protein
MLFKSLLSNAFFLEIAFSNARRRVVRQNNHQIYLTCMHTQSKKKGVLFPISQCASKALPRIEFVSSVALYRTA